MNRANVIIIEQGPDARQCWGNFKRACIENGLPYHSLKMLTFPIVYKGYTIRKVKFN